MKIGKIAFIFGAVAVVAAANAQVSLTTNTYSEDFNNLPTSTITGHWSATVGVQNTVTGTGWAGTKLGGTSTSGPSFEYNAGGSSAGTIHNVGAASSTDRAVGLLASGTNIMGVGVQITNNTGSAISSIDLQFAREIWRSSTSVQNIMAFSYARSSTSTASSANFLTSTSNFTTMTSLDLVGQPPVTTNGALDGNANAMVVSDSITFATPLAVGESLFLRWHDVNDAGNDALIAIDDFSLTAHPVPEPATMAVLGLGAAALIRRRKK